MTFTSNTKCELKTGNKNYMYAYYVDILHVESVDGAIVATVAQLVIALWQKLEA